MHALADVILAWQGLLLSLVVVVLVDVLIVAILVVVDALCHEGRQLVLSQALGVRSQLGIALILKTLIVKAAVAKHAAAALLRIVSRTDRSHDVEGVVNRTVAMLRDTGSELPL